VQAQILPYIQAGATFSLPDIEDIICVLNNALGDPGALATARSKLHQLKQGKKEFTNYFAEIQTFVSKLDWNEREKTDALKEGLSIELRHQLIRKSRDLTYDQLVALCQELDSEMRALQMTKGKQGYQQPRAHQLRNPPLYPAHYTNATCRCSRANEPKWDSIGFGTRESGSSA